MIYMIQVFTVGHTAQRESQVLLTKHAIAGYKAHRIIYRKGAIGLRWILWHHKYSRVDWMRRKIRVHKTVNLESG